MIPSTVPCNETPGKALAPKAWWSFTLASNMDIPGGVTRSDADAVGGRTETLCVDLPYRPLCFFLS